MKIFIRLSLFFLILLLGVAGILGYHTFYNQLPDHSATLRLAGVQSTVDVHWDPYGVPYIYADSEADLYFTVGYLHAQDRLWQLTLSQLMAEGRFSEFLGESFIDIDKHQRTLGIWKTAESIIRETDPAIASKLESYSDGINRYVDQNRDRLPIEMTLLGISPITWTPTHSVAVSRLMAWDQNIQWKSEVALALLAAEIGQGRLNQLLPNQYNNDMSSFDPVERQPIESVNRDFLKADNLIKQMMQNNGMAVGSNAWAVSGERTTNGQPTACRRSSYGTQHSRQLV